MDGIPDSVTMALDCDGLMGKERLEVVTSALALAMAYALPLPTGAVENVEIYFTQNFRAETNRIISKVNEREPLNVPAIQSLTMGLWKTRYRMVYEPSHPSAIIALEQALASGTLGEINFDLVSSLRDEKRQRQIRFLTRRFEEHTTKQGEKF